MATVSIGSVAHGDTMDPIFGSTRKQAIAAGALVGAVVLALGVGSGLGLVVSERRTSRPAPVAPLTLTPATPIEIPVVPTASEVLPAPELTLIAPLPVVATPETPPALTTPKTPPVLVVPAVEAAPSPAPAPAVAPPPVVCTPTFEPVGPLVKHLQAAHLEESPSQMIEDLLDLDQYTLTHTVLVNNMLTGGC